jgi:CRP/FNR family transcriptional regulator, cyclic AMP receptor protein
MNAKKRVGPIPSDCRTLLMRGVWFAGLPAPLRQDLIERGQLKRFRRGASVYRQGDPPRGLWAVLDGEIAFSKVGRSGTEVVYHVGGPGMWFGVLGALTGLPLGVAVAAASDLTLLHVPRKAVQEIVAADPWHVLRLVRLPLARAVDLLDLVEHVVRPSPRSRVAARLLLMERLETEHDSAAAGTPLRVSQSQLAAMTALSRQSVSRALHELAEAGAVTVGFRQVSVADAARLQAIADAPE